MQILPTKLNRPVVDQRWGSRHRLISALYNALSSKLTLISAPAICCKTHAYTVFLSGFLVICAIAQLLGGNGALSVMTSALIIGNAEVFLSRIPAIRFSDRLQHSYFYAGFFPGQAHGTKDDQSSDEELSIIF